MFAEVLQDSRYHKLQCKLQELNPSNAPSARASHTAVWDASDSQMLVFGGIAAALDLEGFSLPRQSVSGVENFNRRSSFQ